MEMNQILVEEDEGVLNDQAPSQTVNPAGFTLGMSPVAEPAGLAPAVVDTGAGTYALSEGMHSERTSSTLSGPGTPRGLQMLLEQPYDPSVDSYERYVRRVNQVCAALSMHEVHSDDALYRSILWDAEITSQIHSFGEVQQMAWLKKKTFARIISAAE